MYKETLSNGLCIVAKSRSVEFFPETKKDPNQDDFHYAFTTETWEKFYNTMLKMAEQAWGHVPIKDATSEASDYAEYYDKEFDNNGSLAIRGDELYISAPFTSTHRLYRFNKRKLGCFLFDLNKKIT